MDFKEALEFFEEDLKDVNHCSVCGQALDWGDDDARS